MWCLPDSAMADSRSATTSPQTEKLAQAQSRNANNLFSTFKSLTPHRVGIEAVEPWLLLRTLARQTTTGSRSAAGAHENLGHMLCTANAATHRSQQVPSAPSPTATPVTASRPLPWPGPERSFLHKVQSIEAEPPDHPLLRTRSTTSTQKVCSPRRSRSISDEHSGKVPWLRPWAGPKHRSRFRAGSAECLRR